MQNKNASHSTTNLVFPEIFSYIIIPPFYFVLYMVPDNIGPLNCKVQYEVMNSVANYQLIATMFTTYRHTSLKTFIA
jgi:hypothetical protein